MLVGIESETGGHVGLCVAVDKEDALLFCFGESCTQMYGRGGFCGPPLETADGDNRFVPHETPSPYFVATSLLLLCEGRGQAAGVHFLGNFGDELFDVELTMHNIVPCPKGGGFVIHLLVSYGEHVVHLS